MTGDELAAAIYAEQGYLVIATRVPQKLGSVIPEMRGANGVSIVPLVKSKTDEADYLKQLKRARELSPEIPRHTDMLAPYYYRVEAAD